MHFEDNFENSGEKMKLVNGCNKYLKLSNKHWIKESSETLRFIKFIYQYFDRSKLLLVKKKHKN